MLRQSPCVPPRHQVPRGLADLQELRDLSLAGWCAACSGEGCGAQVGGGRPRLLLARREETRAQEGSGAWASAQTHPPRWCGSVCCRF